MSRAISEYGQEEQKYAVTVERAAEKRNPNYEIAGTLKPFPRKMTAFSRRQWDKTCIGYGKKGISQERIIAKGEPGYSRVDFALQSASWTIASTMGHLAYSHERLKGAGEKDRYEPQDISLFTDRVKNAARLYGAGVVGVCQLNPLWLYSNDKGELVNLPGGVDKAIVMAVEMEREWVVLSPTAESAAATGNGYSRMAFTAACMAEFLRDLGWQAVPCGNDTALSIPLAIDAGLGACGRNGMLITQKFGPRVRLCKVFTDAPLESDEPIEFGVIEFCENCLKCALECPPQAIPYGERTVEGVCASNNPGALKWHVHAEKCLNFWRVNGVSCLNCIRSCPFSNVE